MATYTVQRNKHATLTAATVDTVTVALRARVEVLNRGATAPLFFTTDGTNPTVGGDDCYIVMPGGSLEVRPNATGPIAIKLISSAANDYSVSGLG